MKIELIDLKEQFKNLFNEINSEVLETLSSANYILGEKVNKFEKEFAKYIGVKNAISVGNGTDALVISLKAMGIGEGDEIITTPFTFFATAEAISIVGAVPIFVDVDIETFNIDASKIEDKVTNKTKAIMPVHIFGQPVNMNKISEIAKKYDLYVIEDACQAIGAKYEGRNVGQLGDIACFSFFPTKNLGCAGDGGMIVTDNDDLAIIARALRTHGSGVNGQKAFNLINNEKENIINEIDDIESVYNPLKYYNYLIGYNSRLDEIQAAILSVKLKEIDKWNSRRRQIAEMYNREFNKLNLVTPKCDIVSEHVYHMYILQSENRSEIITKLKERGISTGIYYPVPLHLQKVYKNLGYKKGDLPVAEYLSERTFAIPIYPELNNEQIQYIIDSVKECI